MVVVREAGCRPGAGPWDVGHGERPAGAPRGIALDRCDLVAQHIFAAGLALQAVADDSEEPAMAPHLLAVATKLDDALRNLRAAVIGLSPTERAGTGTTGAAGPPARRPTSSGSDGPAGGDGPV